MTPAEFFSRQVLQETERKMSEQLHFHFDVDGNDFTSAGHASVSVKKNLRRLGLDPETASSGSASSLGIDMGSYPSAKQVIFGLNLSF